MRTRIARLPIVLVVGGSLYLGSARTFAQAQGQALNGGNIYIPPISASPSTGGLFSAFEIPTGDGLPLSGKFEVPFYGKMFTNGRFTGATRWQASDGTRFLMIARVTARVAGTDQSREVILSIRPDPKNPSRMLFVGKMAKSIDDAVLAEMKSKPTVAEQIDHLIANVQTEDVRGGKKPEAQLELDSTSPLELKLFRLKDDGSRADRVTFKRALLAGGGALMTIQYKGSTLEVTMPK